jgi:hypothetical protein
MARGKLTNISHKFRMGEDGSLEEDIFTSFPVWRRVQINEFWDTMAHFDHFPIEEELCYVDDKLAQQITTKVTKGVFERLKALEQREDRSVSYLLREAVELLLEQREP